MNKTVTSNISGIVFHIDEDAYDKLGKYLQTIRGYFKDSEGREEIMADIEARIAEMFQERVTQGKQVIVMADVDHVISVMGQPEDFAGDEVKQDEKKEEPQPEERRRTRRLYRDPDDGMVGGVCSGLGYYFGIDPVWIRGGFLVAFFFFGTGLLFYILLMIIIPKALTTSEKLEMRGESVTVDNIRRTVEEEFGHLKKKMSGHGNERRRRRDRIEEGVGDFFHAIFTVFGKVIAIAFVVFGLFFLIGLLTAMFGLGSFSSDAASFAMHSVFPSSGHYTAAIVAAALVIGIPCVMMIYSGIRLLFKIEKRNRIVNYSALGLWIIGIILGSWVLTNALGEFSDQKDVSENITLPSAKQDTLILRVKVEPGTSKGGGGYGGKFMQVHERGWHLWQIGNGSVKLGYPGLHIEKAESDSFELEVVRSAAGRDGKLALEHARRISYNLGQKDSLLEFGSHFEIGKGDPWRAQEVDMILRVPVGKVIYLHESTRYILDDIPNVTGTWDGDMPGHYWIMTPKGLQCYSDCKEINEEAEQEKRYRDTIYIEHPDIDHAKK